MVTVVIEVEYDAGTEIKARALAARDAEAIFNRPDVLAVSFDLKRSRAEEMPIVAAYLSDESTPKTEEDEYPLCSDECAGEVCDDCKFVGYCLHAQEIDVLLGLG